MAKLLRKVKRNRWYKSEAQILLDSGDVPADPLGDMTTSQNKLSVFQVDERNTSVERIARALALSAQRIDNVGYVLFDASLLQEASIEVDPCEGETLDSVVNKCHADLINLTGNKLVTLTRLILLQGEVNQILKKRIIQLVEEGLGSKELPESAREKLPIRA